MGVRRHDLVAQMGVLPPATPLVNGAPPSTSRFLDVGGAPVSGGTDNDQPTGQQISTKRRKAIRYRDLTCPRTRTSQLADGTRIVTVGSHVLVYPAPAALAAAKGQPPPPAVEGAKAHPKDKAAATGAITTFEEHPIFGFDDNSFKHYSLGVGLYFKGVRMLACIFLLCSFITLPIIVLSILSNPTGPDDDLYFEKTSLGNFGSLLTLNSTKETTWGDLPSNLTKDQLTIILSSLDALACVVLLVFGMWLRRRQETESRAYSRREITVKKYSVEVGNLPLKFHDRYKLAMWFQERFGQVVDCAISFDQHDLLNVYRSRGILRKDIDMAVSHGETSRLDGLYEQLEKIDNRIHDIQQDLPHRRTLGAYITFEHQESRIACEKAFSNQFLKRLAGHWKDGKVGTLAGSETGSVVGGIGADPNKTLLFGRDGRILLVRQAPEPSNILFKNLKYSPRNKFLRRCVTFLLTGLLISVSVSVVYLAQRFQGETPTSGINCQRGLTSEQVREDPSLTDCFCYHLGTAYAWNSENEYGIDCKSWLTSYAIARGLAVLSVLTIVIVNFILKMTIKSLTQFEKHHSLTRQQESITNKLFVGLFLNTAIVLLVVNMQFQSDVTNIGFSASFDDFEYGWFVHVGSSIMLTMILNTLNPHLLPFLRVKYRRSRRETCCAPKEKDPQSLWNARYAGDEFDLSERYAVLLNTLFVTLLYSGGLPLLLPIASITFMFTYIMDKVSFLRLYRIPPRFDHSLAMYTTTLLPYGIFLHLAFALWFYSAPILHSYDLTPIYQGNEYEYSTLSERITQWSVLPILILLAMVGLYLFIFRFCSFLYHTWRDGTLNVRSNELNNDASKFVPYSVARRTVTLETYHPHGSPYFHDAFIRTPSRKMLKIPTPLHILQEEARQAAWKKQQAMVEKQAYQERQTNQAQPNKAWVPPTINVDDDDDDEEIVVSSVSPKTLSSVNGGGAKTPSRPELKRGESMGIRPQNQIKSPLEVRNQQREAAKNVARSISKSTLPPITTTPGGVTTGASPAWLDSNGPVTRGALSPRARAGLTKSDAAAIVVLDIPDRTMDHVSGDVFEELGGGGPTVNGEDAQANCGQSDQDRRDHQQQKEMRKKQQLEGSVEQQQQLHRHHLTSQFSSHLQHHTHLSLPTEDPLLPQVKTQLHQVASSLGRDAMMVDDAHPGEVNRRNKKHSSTKKKSKKSSKPASVHDSSRVPTLGDDAIGVRIDDPSSTTQSEESDPNFVSTIVDADHSPGTSNDTKRTLGNKLPSDVDSLSDQVQLIPISCPNSECGRMLELVDTGMPHLYHCPFCAQSFIM